MGLNKPKIAAVACAMVFVLAVWYFGVHRGFFWQGPAEREVHISILRAKIALLARHGLEMAETSEKLYSQTQQLEKLRKENQELRQAVGKMHLDERAL